MMAHSVTGVADSLQEHGISADIVTYHEEGGPDVVFFKNVQYPGCDFRYGPVIKSQVYSFLTFRARELPYCLRTVEAVWQYGSLNEHYEVG